MSVKSYYTLNNGINLPAVGLGSWQATGPEFEAALDSALEAGYRYFDTGIFYENQHIVGQKLTQWFAENKIKREDLIISSTFSIMGTDNVEMLLDMSLQFLQIDYVDLLLIQFPVGIKFNPETFKTYQFEIDLESNITEIWKKMEELVDKGKAKGIGFSSFSIPQIEKLLNSARIKPCCMQLEIHPMLQQEEIVNFCKHNNIHPIAFCPLGSPGYNNFIKLLGAEMKPLPNVLANETIKAIASKYNKAPAQISLRYALQRGLSVIPKSVCDERIRENISIFDFDLDCDDTSKIKALDVGPKSRIVDYAAFSQFKDHPDYPF